MFGSRIARFVAFAALPLLTGCAGTSDPSGQAAPRPVSAIVPPAQLANPAFRNCVEQGGTHVTERAPGGGQYGVCLFTENRQCEEWALLRGECPSGGLRVTGYSTPASRYCVITGGLYTVVRTGPAIEQDRCVLPGGTTCDSAAYYEGSCGRR